MSKIHICSGLKTYVNNSMKLIIQVTECTNMTFFKCRCQYSLLLLFVFPSHRFSISKYNSKVNFRHTVLVVDWLQSNVHLYHQVDGILLFSS